MRSVSEKSWERALSRYLHAQSLPFKWDAVAKRFTGLHGHMIARINPYSEEEAWKQMPKRIRGYESRDRNPERRKVIVFVTNSKYGDSIDDTLVVMRVGTLIPMLKAYNDTLDRR